MLLYRAECAECVGGDTGNGGWHEQPLRSALVQQEDVPGVQGALCSSRSSRPSQVVLRRHHCCVWRQASGLQERG